jgi:septal ring factor EnvC (AmiA/AmiB activator)
VARQSGCKIKPYDAPDVVVGAPYPFNVCSNERDPPLRDVAGLRAGHLICLLALVLSGMCPCVAADSGQAAIQAQRLQQLRSRIDGLKNEMGAVLGRKNAADAELEKTEKEIGTVASSLRQLERKISQSRARLDGLQEERQASERNLRGMRSVLARDLRSAYETGQEQQQVRLLLDQDDPASIARLMTYYGYFSRARADRIGRVKSALDALTRAEQAVREQQSDLEKLQAEQVAESERLERVRAERQAVLSRLQAELGERSSELAALERDEKDLQRLVESLRRALKAVPPATEAFTSPGPLKGKLVWPVDGRISIPFGAVQADGKLRSKGVLVNASAGSDVHAIAAGRVVFADWLRGFGLLLIIDHGKGYMSLYGYNRSLYKEVGDKVGAGEVVAAVGDSGGRERAGLYLELRKDGRPFDPVSWFGGKSSRLRAGN